MESTSVARIRHARRKKAAKRAALATFLVIVLVLAGGVAWGYSILHSAQQTMNENSQDNGDLEKAITPRVPDEPFTVLLLGQDNRPGESAARADTIIVARIDPENDKVWMLSIPRDTRVEIPGYGTDKINAATFHGGPALMVDTVEEFLGIPVNHYMDIEFDGFIQVVDSLGGVWIDVDAEIDDEKASSHGSYTASYIAEGYQLLDGDHALTFVRSRDFPDADFTRMRHQQQFFKALADQATQFDNVIKIPGMVEDVAQFMSTDMSMSQIIEVAMALRDMGGANVQTATVMGEWKSPYVWPDEDKKEFLVDAMMAGLPFDATATVETGIDPSAVTVTVRNGAGIEGCATAASDMLTQAGYAVGEVGNANQFVYEETLVIYSTDRAAAVQVATVLPKGRVVESRGMYSFSTDVLVVVGKDYTTW
ncbi:MAG: LCP family protein [Coriobacteriia bacterium]|nr:LCP family protein [Coriobacteriia bacterium]